jgi:alcohol dehydrogenase (NADP+)
MFAKAMGATVTAISHSASKKADAEAMGATTFVATHGDDGSVKENAGTLDLIVVTTNDTRMPIMTTSPSSSPTVTSSS